MDNDMVAMIMRCHRTFSQFDKNGDGQLEWDEFKAYVEKRNNSADAE